MKNETRETLIWIFCISVVVLLSVKLYYEADDYTCDECRVNMTTRLAGSGYIDFGNPRVDILFEAYKNGDCLIIWDPVGGFVKNGYAE